MAKGKSRKKTSLKAALSSQQSRLKKKQEAAQAAQIAEKSKKGAQSNAKGNKKALPPRPTIPFKATDHILLVGEGNFSFTRALVSHPPASLVHLPAANVTATAFDSEEECHAKYPDAADIVSSLRDKGVEVVFGVDATRLEKYAALKGRKWDRVVWNFPHAGKGITDQDRNILTNQMLILGFLRSAAHVLAAGTIPTVMSTRKRKRESDAEDDEVEDAPSEGEGHADGLSSVHSKTRGTILVTLRNVPPYTLWDIPKLAKSPPPPKHASGKANPRYIQLRSFVFHREEWKGYEHRMTKGERAHGQGKTGEGGEDRTWEFCLKLAMQCFSNPRAEDFPIVLH